MDAAPVACRDKGSLFCSKVGECLDKYWAQKKVMCDAEPELVTRMLHKARRSPTFVPGFECERFTWRVRRSDLSCTAQLLLEREGGASCC